MKNCFKLSWGAVERLADMYGSPLLVLSLEQVEYNYNFLKNHLPGVKVYYAVKSNPDARLVQRLAELGSCFDVASDGEIRALTDMGISAERMLYANPVKTPSGLAEAKRTGVYQFTFDSESEIHKMAEAVPGAKVLLRVRIDNTRSLIDLNKKFGAHPDEALHLLKLAKQAGLDVAGLCFHVGSQATTSDAYLHALDLCRNIFDQAKQAGIDLHVLDIGGGFPIPNGDLDLDIEVLTSQIYTQLKNLFADIEIWAEPGRFICGTTTNLITRVIGTQVRNGKQWYFLDEGLYGTFSGILFDHWEYEMETMRKGIEIEATFAGPSCDSLDILFRDRITPPLETGDILLVSNCGAYTSASATTFNGFAKATTIVWEEVCKELLDGIPAVG